MFNIFKQNDKNGSQVLPHNGQIPNNGTALPEVEERVFIESAPPNGQAAAPAPVVENNINVLYTFMDRNHEVRGYDDALLNPDASHLSQNLEALKNELIRTLNRVKTFYEDFIQETDFHIQSRSRSGMVDMVEELEMKKKIALGHIEKVKTIEADTMNEEGNCKGILISYTRGFKNGLAAISHHHILSRRF
ncbi:MAG TPA: hypothetical protein VGM63_13115 [Mucilaginibacter sp.]|jgi:hypothetical protein